MVPRCPAGRDPNVRQNSGCGEPAPEGLYFVTCPECDGGSYDCERCNERGNVTVFPCPRLASGRDALELLRAYGAFERGCMPPPRVWREQSASFADWVNVISGERGVIDAKGAEELKRGEADHSAVHRLIAGAR